MNIMIEFSPNVMKKLKDALTGIGDTYIDLTGLFKRQDRQLSSGKGGSNALETICNEIQNTG